jgi:hypothetical protein
VRLTARRRSRWVVAIASGLSALALMACVQACALDNVPSISMNGHLAVLNHKVPHNLKLYAPFLFKQHVTAGNRVHLSENRSEVAKSLTAATMKHEPRWWFGDGSKPRFGWSVQHTYTRHGIHRVTVQAYYAKGKRWYNFDDSLVTVTKPK